MVRDSGRKRLPPYVSYRSFQNFIDRLQQGIPSRIDRSYWEDRLSGTTGTQLMATLRFLGLIEASGTPTSRLRQLVAARGAQRTDVLREVTAESFGFLLPDSFDAQTATYAQLEEVFQRTFEMPDSVSRKCVKFFVALASEARMPLSPFITKRMRTLPTNTATKPAVKKRGIRTRKDLTIPQDFSKIPVEVSWDKMLLNKFPTWDATWSDEVKLGWLEAFVVLKFPALDPAWSDEVRLKWFSSYDKLRERSFPQAQR